jgi:large subunit ribosomal protein L18
MYYHKDRKDSRVKVRRRIRDRVAGTAERPRLAICRSEKHIYAQAIDDAAGHTLASASTLDAECKAQIKGSANIGAAKVVGKALAARLLAKGIDQAVFDRGGFRYHGRMKALADAAREGGLKF